MVCQYYNCILVELLFLYLLYWNIHYMKVLCCVFFSTDTVVIPCSFDKKTCPGKNKRMLDKPVFCITWRFLLCMKELIVGGSDRLCAVGSCVDRVKGTWQWDRFFDFFGVNLFGKDLWQVWKPFWFWLGITEMLVIDSRHRRKQGVWKTVLSSPFFKPIGTDHYSCCLFLPNCFFIVMVEAFKKVL